MLSLRTSGDWIQRLHDCLNKNLTAEPTERALPELLHGLAPLARDPAGPASANNLSAVTQYQRFGLADSVSPRYSSLAILWPPGHASPVHDHGGLWGLEVVVSGALEIDEYDILSPRQLRHRHHGVLHTGEGTWFAGHRFAHSCRNASTSEPALTLHVYGGDLAHYTAYEPMGHYPVEPVSQTTKRSDERLIVE